MCRGVDTTAWLTASTVQWVQVERVCGCVLELSVRLHPLLLQIWLLLVSKTRWTSHWVDCCFLSVTTKSKVKSHKYTLSVFFSQDDGSSDSPTYAQVNFSNRAAGSAYSPPPGDDDVIYSLLQKTTWLFTAASPLSLVDRTLLRIVWSLCERDFFLTLAWYYFSVLCSFLPQSNTSWWTEGVILTVDYCFSLKIENHQNRLHGYIK